MAAPSANPYAVALAALEERMYPTPSPGFEARIFVLLGLAVYLIAATVVFYVFYGLVLKKQGRRVHAWRLVSRPEGRYISGNIYIVTVLPVVGAAILIGGFLLNTRAVFLHKASQYHTFCWRSLIWLLVWTQGWISSYANLQAVLITSHNTSYPRLSRWTNAVYIAVPSSVVIGMLVPATLSCRNWDRIYTLYLEMHDLLSASSAYLMTNGRPDLSNMAAIKLAGDEMTQRLDEFASQYLVMLVVWLIGSFLLIIVNCVGVVLIMRLQRQIEFNAQLTSFKDTKAFSSQTRSNGSRFGSGDNLVDTFHARSSPSSPSAPAFLEAHFGDNRVENLRSLFKLKRDLMLTVVGVTLVVTIFCADILLLALKRSALFDDWQITELAMTLAPWSYLVICSVMLTGVTINHASFYFATSPRPTVEMIETSPAPMTPSRHARRQSKSYAEAIQISTVREVTVETPTEKERADATSLHSRRHTASRVERSADPDCPLPTRSGRDTPMSTFSSLEEDDSEELTDDSRRASQSSGEVMDEKLGRAL